TINTDIPNGLSGITTVGADLYARFNAEGKASSSTSSGNKPTSAQSSDMSEDESDFEQGNCVPVTVAVPRVQENNEEIEHPPSYEYIVAQRTSQLNAQPVSSMHKTDEMPDTKEKD
ncbi:hypothetical protein GGF39_003089, partial [Coemansia sp. RSA 1721]